MNPDSTTKSVIIDPAFTFGELEQRLDEAGWERTSVAAATTPIRRGEEEIAQWRSAGDDVRLTYTYNPVVDLRVARITSDAAGANSEDGDGSMGGRSVRDLMRSLPIVDLAGVNQWLTADEPREILRGVLAASEMEAVELAGPIGLLAGNRDRSVAETAARVHLELLHHNAALLATTDRTRELAATLQAISGNAFPLLSALVTATPDEILGLQPLAEDCAEVLDDRVAEAVFEAYDELYRNPPKISPGSDRNQLRVHACPAGLLGSDNEFSHVFPVGYRDVAHLLVSGRVWLAWRYCRPGRTSGLAFDGLVHARGSWVWFPKLFRVLGRVVQQHAASR